MQLVYKKQLLGDATYYYDKSCLGCGAATKYGAIHSWWISQQSRSSRPNKSQRDGLLRALKAALSLAMIH